MNREIRIEVVYPHSPDQVWKAIADPGGLEAWLMPNDFRPLVGHRFQFRTSPAPGFDGIVRCEVLEADGPRRLSYSWAGGPIQSVVTFVLEPVAGGTRLLFEHTGFDGDRGVGVSRSSIDIERSLSETILMLEEGWNRKIAGGSLTRVVANIADGSFQEHGAGSQPCS